MVYIESNFECSKTLPRNAGELTEKMQNALEKSPQNFEQAEFSLECSLESLSSANYRAE